MDNEKTGHQDAGNGQKSNANDNPSAEGLCIAPLQASKGVEGVGVGVSGGAVEGESEKKEGETEIDGELIDEEPEAVEKPRKLTARDGKTEIKHAAALILSENGLSHGAIAQALERHPKHIGKILPEMKKHSLASPDMARLAKTGVKAVMAGFIGKREKQPDGTVAVVTDRRVKASDMLKAAEMVQARYDPPEQAAAPGAQTFLQINVNQYNQRD